MLNDMFKDVTAIAMAIVGVAILYTLVSPRNKTTQVVAASGNAFAQAISAAMGASVSGGGVIGG